MFVLLIILHLLQSNFRFESSGTVLHAYIAMSNMKLWSTALQGKIYSLMHMFMCWFYDCEIIKISHVHNNNRWCLLKHSPSFPSTGLMEWWEPWTQRNSSRPSLSSKIKWMCYSISMWVFTIGYTGWHLNQLLTLVPCIICCFHFSDPVGFQNCWLWQT